MFLFFLIIFLPLLEIAGFIAVGGRIGVGLSLLWVVLDVVVGLSLLTGTGGITLRRAQQSTNDDAYPFEEMFDGFCTIIGALLLIFPGFISDALALPLLLPPLRRGLFYFLKNQHSAVFNDLGSRSRGFAHWYYEERAGSGRVVKTIEGTAREDTAALRHDKDLDGHAS